MLLVLTVLIDTVCSAAPVMVEKNVFAMDRKPPPPESASAPATPTRPGMGISNIQLDGVIINGNSKKAILRMKNQPGGAAAAKKGQSPFVTVREGQQIGDMRVTKIEPKSISLEKDGQTFTVNLFADNKVVTPPAPMPAPAQAQPVPPPGVQPPEGVPNQPPGVPQPGQAGFNPRIPQQQMIPQQMPAPNPGAPGYVDPSVDPNAQQNAEVAGQEPVQDPNQPGDLIEEEQQ